MTSGPMDEMLARWKAAFDGHRVAAAADLFTPDALFQGFGPQVLVGRDAIHAYYEAVPDNRSADVTLLHTYTIGQETAGGSHTSPSGTPPAGKPPCTCRWSSSSAGVPGEFASTTYPGSAPSTDKGRRRCGPQHCPLMRRGPTEPTTGGSLSVIPSGVGRPRVGDRRDVRHALREADVKHGGGQDSGLTAGRQQ